MKYVFLLLLAICIAVVRCEYQIQHLPKYPQHQFIIAQGIIAGIPKPFAHHQQFDFSISEFDENKIAFKARLNWYGKSPELIVGDQWQLMIKLKQPRGFMNPGGFDYKGALLAQKIVATGYVKNSQSNHFMKSNLFSHTIDRFRQYLANQLDNQLIDFSEARFIKALSLGIRNGITVDDWRVFQFTGTSHLVAISGLHIGLVAAFFMLLTHFVWRCFPSLYFVVAVTRAGAISAVFGALIYAALSGFSTPTLRALMMILFFMWDRFSLRSSTFIHIWSIAFAISLVMDPFAWRSASFWLSYLAVIWLAYATKGRLSCDNKLQRIFRSQVAVTLGLMPLVIQYFQQISLISLIANLMAIPTLSFLIVPLCLSGTLLLLVNSKLAVLFLFVSAKLIGFLWLFLHYLSGIDFLHQSYCFANHWIFITACIGIFFFLSPKQFPQRYLAIIWLLPAVLFRNPVPEYGAYDVNILDVGQGLAIVVQTQRHTLIFDTGAKFSEQFDAANAAILPFLRKSGVREIDKLIVSHGDNDHSGGVNSIMNALPVKSLITSVPEKFKLFHAALCQIGQSWNWDGVSFNIIYPDATHLHLGNDSSCVLRIANGHFSALLTGDIEKSAESVIIENATRILASELLIAPHHGSKTSSTAAFINAVKPHYVVFSTGDHNKFHFPHRIVVDRYAHVHTHLYDTAKEGAVMFHVTKNNFNVEITRR